MTASSDPDIIHLSDKDLLIATGAFCRCYRHPDNPDLCIKLPTSNAKAARRLRADLAYYRKLHRKETDLSHLADYLGACPTDLGTGHLFECITDANSSTSRTLGHYLKHEPDLHNEIIDALEKLACYLEKNRIMIGDIHERNILLRITPDKPPTAIIIDGIGDRVAIPVLNLFGSLVDAKIARRWNRFINKLQALHPSVDLPVTRLHLSEKK